MNLTGSVVLSVAGVVLVISFAEKPVTGVAGTSAGFAVSAFIITVVFIGFDPQNLALGAVGSLANVSGIALGSIIGAAIVAISLAFGVTALIVPMEFERARRPVLAVPVAAVMLFAALARGGTLSRLDGDILLIGFVAAVLSLIWLITSSRSFTPSLRQMTVFGSFHGWELASAVFHKAITLYASVGSNLRTAISAIIDYLQCGPRPLADCDTPSTSAAHTSKPACGRSAWGRGGFALCSAKATAPKGARRRRSRCGRCSRRTGRSIAHGSASRCSWR